MYDAKKYANAIRDLDPDAVRPYAGRVWLQRIPPFDETAGGIEMPHLAKKVQNYAIVERIAPDLEDKGLSPGDIVMVDAYTGNEMDFGGGRTFLMVDFDQIKAILDNPSSM